MIGLLISCSLHRMNQVDTPAERIAYAGHGGLFDKDLQPVEFDSSSIAEMQDSIMDEIRRKAPKFLPKNAASVIFEARTVLDHNNLDDAEVIFIKSGIVGTVMKYVSEDVSTRYTWRNRVIVSHYLKTDFERIPNATFPFKAWPAIDAGPRYFAPGRKPSGP